MISSSNLLVILAISCPAIIQRLRAHRFPVNQIAPPKIFKKSTDWFIVLVDCQCWEFLVVLCTAKFPVMNSARKSGGLYLRPTISRHNLECAWTATCCDAYDKGQTSRKWPLQGIPRTAESFLLEWTWRTAEWGPASANSCTNSQIWH